MAHIYEDLLNIIIASTLGALLFSIFSINRYIYFIIPVLFFFLVNYFTKMIFAHKLGFKIRTKFLTFKRLWFGEQNKFPFAMPAWIIFPLLFSFLSYSAIKLLTILGFDYETTIKRIRREFEFIEYDVAKISIAGLISCFFFVLLFYYLKIYEFALVGIWFVLSNSLPLGSLDGSKIFHASWITWSFYFIFFLISLILINIAGILASVILALIFALAVVVYSLYKYLK